MKLLIRFLVLGAIIGLAAYILPGVAVDGYGSALLVVLVLGILQVTLGAILRFLTIPINVLTLGLVGFIINVLIIMLAGSLMEGFEVANFISGVLFALVVSILRVIASSVTEIDA